MIKELAAMLRLSRTHAEESLYNARAARAVLSRRNLFAASAALATGTLFSGGAERHFIQIGPGETVVDLLLSRPALVEIYGGTLRSASFMGGATVKFPTDDGLAINCYVRGGPFPGERGVFPNDGIGHALWAYRL